MSGRCMTGYACWRRSSRSSRAGWPDMQSTKPPFAVRFLPSLTDMAFLMPIVFLCARMDGAKTLLADGDTGWHIRTGEWILNHHQVPARDPFSFTKPGETWFAWEWLSDVIFAWLNSHGGMATLL